MPQGSAKRAAIRAMIIYLLAQAVANSIAAFAIVVVVFAFTGQWPPRVLLVGSSIGGAMSPLAWRTYRAIRPHPAGPPKALSSVNPWIAAGVAPDTEPAAAADGGRM
jgi:hypothetical protein